MKTIIIKTRKQWRNWLVKNHKKEKKVALVSHKKHTGVPFIHHKEALEEEIINLKKSDGVNIDLEVISHYDENIFYFLPKIDKKYDM